jgi:hypothetical protein
MVGYMEGPGIVAQQALTTLFAASNFSYMEGQGIVAQQALTIFFAASNISFLCARYNLQYLVFKRKEDYSMSSLLVKLRTFQNKAAMYTSLQEAPILKYSSSSLFIKKYLQLQM